MMFRVFRFLLFFFSLCSSFFSNQQQQIFLFLQQKSARREMKNATMSMIYEENAPFLTD